MLKVPEQVQSHLKQLGRARRSSWPVLFSPPLSFQTLHPTPQWSKKGRSPQKDGCSCPPIALGCTRSPNTTFLLPASSRTSKAAKHIPLRRSGCAMEIYPEGRSKTAQKVTEFKHQEGGTRLYKVLQVRTKTSNILKKINRGMKSATHERQGWLGLFEQFGG